MKTIDDFKALAELKNLVFVNEKLITRSCKYLWRCKKCNYEMNLTYQALKDKKYGCVKCIGFTRLTYEDLIALAKNRNFEFLSNETSFTARKKYKWKCSIGHIWTANYSNIRRGTGCPYCCHSLKKTEEDYLILGKQKNLILIKMAKNASEPSTWKCKNGHLWESSYTKAKYNKCIHCSHVKPKTEQDYINLGKEKKVEYLGPLPKDRHHATNWKCKCGNTYKRAWPSIKHGTALCRKCIIVSLSGENSIFFNHNLPKEYRTKLNENYKRQKWARVIYKKYKFTCLKCSSLDNIHAHHIFNWGNYPKLRYEEQNGVVLCENCHVDFHCTYGRLDNTAKQLIDFIPEKKDEILDIIKFLPI